MEDIEKLHFRQYRFLRDLREAADTGLCDRPWPRVTTLRRWLRRPGFRAALRSLQAALRFQRDWMLSVSAAQAARNLAAMVSEQDPRSGVADPDSRLASLVRIIRTEQIRQRERPRRRQSPGQRESSDQRQSSDQRRFAGQLVPPPIAVASDPTPDAFAIASWASHERRLRGDTGDAAGATDAADSVQLGINRTLASRDLPRLDRHRVSP